MVNATTHGKDFLAKNGSKPSQEPNNFPSDEEFFALLINFQWDAVESSLVDALAQAATSKGKVFSHGASKKGCAVRLGPA